MKKEISKNPSVIVEYKTIDTLVFIEKIFKESEIEGLTEREWSQVMSCIINMKRHLLDKKIDCHYLLGRHWIKHPLAKNNNKISIKKKGE